MSRPQRNYYKSLEKAILSEHTDYATNAISVCEDDFANNKLLYDSFARMKEESWSIPYKEQIEINIPRDLAGIYNEDIRHKVYTELVKVRQERIELTVRCIWMFLAGVAALATALYVPFINDMFFLFEIIIIASSMFIWVTIETWVVDGRVLYNQRFTLLQLLAARVNAQ